MAYICLTNLAKLFRRNVESSVSEATDQFCCSKLVKTLFLIYQSSSALEWRHWNMRNKKACSLQEFVPSRDKVQVDTDMWHEISDSDSEWTQVSSFLSPHAVSSLRWRQWLFDRRMEAISVIYSIISSWRCFGTSRRQLALISAVLFKDLFTTQRALS